MNTQLNRLIIDEAWHRHAEIYRYLEEIAQDLDLTDQQFEKARREHKKLCDWLSDDLNVWFQDILLYSHGSLALGTATKPLGRAEFDIDMICLVRRGHAGMDPGSIKALIGDKLGEHPEYAKILEEKKRCWRLNFPGDFHLDIAGTIPNRGCANNSEFVPDKDLREWHSTNPQGFRELFERRAALKPQLKKPFAPLVERTAARAETEPFPEQPQSKDLLRRLVQLLKRHRDHHFLEMEDDIAPISIIITTLLMRSYEHCVEWYTLENELEFLVEVIRMMPHFIDIGVSNGCRTYAVWNESTADENFADSWNEKPAKVKAFYDWHAKALSDFEEIRRAVGLDTVISLSNEQFGKGVVERVMSKRNRALGDARKSQALMAAPVIGLTSSPASAGTRIPKNDFFGD